MLFHLLCSNKHYYFCSFQFKAEEVIVSSAGVIFPPSFYTLIDLHWLWGIHVMLPSNLAEVRAMLCCFPNNTGVISLFMQCCPECHLTLQPFFSKIDFWGMMIILQWDSHSNSAQCMLTITVHHITVYQCPCGRRAYSW